MNEMVGVGVGLGLGRLGRPCHGPTLSASGRPPPPPPPGIPTPPRQQKNNKKKAFFPCLVSHSRGTAATPVPLHLPSRSPFLFKYCKPSTFPCHCTDNTDVAEPEPPESSSVDCVGTGSDVECVVLVPPADTQKSSSSSSSSWWEWAVLVSPFFFWGTAMVAMKPVIPKTGPLFVSAFRLIPAGFLLVAFAASQRRRPPSGLQAWLSISLFALVDASCFQVSSFPSGSLPLLLSRPKMAPFPCFLMMMRIRVVGDGRVSLLRACRGLLPV